MGCRRGRGDDQKTIHAAQRRSRAMQRGWVVRGELGRAMLTSLPALARGSSWLARASTVLGRLGWAAQGGAQVSFSLYLFSVFCFYLIYLQLC